MTSKRLSARVRANRANAAKSTGPRTLAGKAIVAANALVHGFASQVGPVFAPEQLDAAARELAPEATSQHPAAFAHAHAAAEAHLVLELIRRRRAELWTQIAAREGAWTPHLNSTSEELQMIETLNRYELQAAARRRRALRKSEAALPLPNKANRK